jgi:hypothetical protein
MYIINVYIYINQPTVYGVWMFPEMAFCCPTMAIEHEDPPAMESKPQNPP